MLHEFAVEQLNELKVLLQDIDENKYSEPMESVYFSTIGKHTRHIIEFYQQFNKAYNKGNLNYDKRKRNKKIETNKFYAVDQLEKLMVKLSLMTDNKKLKLKVDVRGETYKIKTTVERESLYLMEHTTHHMALIRIGISNLQQDLTIADHVGIAYSTPHKKA